MAALTLPPFMLLLWTCGDAWTSSCTGWRRRCQAGNALHRELPDCAWSCSARRVLKCDVPTRPRRQSPTWLPRSAASPSPWWNCGTAARWRWCLRSRSSWTSRVCSALLPQQPSVPPKKCSLSAWHLCRSLLLRGAGALRVLRQQLRSPAFACLDEGALGSSVSESSTSGSEGRATHIVRRSRGELQVRCGAPYTSIAEHMGAAPTFQAAGATNSTPCVWPMAPGPLLHLPFKQMNNLNRATAPLPQALGVSALRCWSRTRARAPPASASAAAPPSETSPSSPPRCKLRCSRGGGARWRCADGWARAPVVSLVPFQQDL